MSAKKGKPINTVEVRARAMEILTSSGYRVSRVSAKDVAKNARISKQDPIIRQFVSSK